VEAFIAQRLIRLICPDCKQQDKSAPLELKKLIARDLGLKSVDEVKIYRGKGCPACNFIGFFGRTAIYEILLVDEAIKDLVLKKAPSSQIKKAAVAKGMRTLRQDGWQKTISGATSPEEVMKVTSIEEESDSDKETDVSGQRQSRPEILPEEKVQSTGLERRVYVRLDSKVNVSYKIIEKEHDLLKRGIVPEQLSVTENISAGGVLLYVDEPLPIGSILELKLELPSESDSIECLARVVRVETTAEKGYLIGVCFLDLSGAERSRLNKYVEITQRG
jgi:hypothetical protein